MPPVPPEWGAVPPGHVSIVHVAPCAIMLRHEYLGGIEKCNTMRKMTALRYGCRQSTGCRKAGDLSMRGLFVFAPCCATSPLRRSRSVIQSAIKYDLRQVRIIRSYVFVHKVVSQARNPTEQKANCSTGKVDVNERIFTYCPVLSSTWRAWSAASPTVLPVR